MCVTTARDIQNYNYACLKARNNDLEIIIKGDSFALTKNSDKQTLGKFVTVGDVFQYICGYEVGLDKGLDDGDLSRFAVTPY